MQANCLEMLKTAGELLTFGVLPEASRELVKLQACSRQAGCDHWHRCLKSVEDRWQTQGTGGRGRVAAD
ncbi:MAG: hypothetical protein HC871_03975 [Rhizobiales bacterium]|nr:hypothetical protein [Hyphomicrobiales bacterium]